MITVLGSWAIHFTLILGRGVGGREGGGMEGWVSILFSRSRSTPIASWRYPGTLVPDEPLVPASGNIARSKRVASLRKMQNNSRSRQTTHYRAQTAKKVFFAFSGKNMSCVVSSCLLPPKNSRSAENKLAF